MDFRKRRRITDPNPEPNPRHAMSDPHPEISLPPDLVSDVLSRLPVKTLLRLRCVCKQWYSLTYDPYFIRTQHQRARSRPVFLKKFIENKTITCCEFGGDGKLERNSFACETLTEASTMHFLGNSVNGLIFASGHRTGRSTCLLNPTTREVLQLPSPCVRYYFRHESFGLGLDYTTGEYKVVIIESQPGKNSFDCEILTVGTRKWRHVGQFPFRINSSLPVFLHGALHWGAKHGGGAGDGGDANLMSIILPFDINNETFGSVIPVPSALPLLKLGELGGHLCAIMGHPLRDSLELWTLKDYGNCQWIKEFSFTLDYFQCSCPFPSVLGPTDQKILFLSYPDVYSYEIQTKTSSTVYHETKGSFTLVAHVEGLVSPRKIVEIA